LNYLICLEFRVTNLTAETPYYLPMISKLHLLRLTQNLFKRSDLSFLTGQEVLNSCMNVRIRLPQLNFTGYCARSFNVIESPVEPKVISWVKQFPEGELRYWYSDFWYKQPVSYYTLVLCTFWFAKFNWLRLKVHPAQVHDPFYLIDM